MLSRPNFELYNSSAITEAATVLYYAVAVSLWGDKILKIYYCDIYRHLNSYNKQEMMMECEKIAMLKVRIKGKRGERFYKRLIFLFIVVGGDSMEICS